MTHTLKHQESFQKQGVSYQRGFLKEVVLDLEARVGGWGNRKAFPWRRHIGAHSKQVLWKHIERWIHIEKAT